MNCVIGLDIGTTSTIGILIRMPSERLALASRPVTLMHLHAGWAEEDPQQWWANVCEIVPQLLAQAGVKASDVKAVGVSGMVPAVVLLDAHGQLLRPSIQQSDGRCAQQVQEMREALDEAAFTRRTGNGINQQLVAAKLRWLQRHEPQVFGSIHTVLGSYDYINHRLTGARRVEQNWALEAGFVDLATGRIADDLVAAGGIVTAQVAPLAFSREVIGAVTPEAAQATGLAPGTPVVAGLADHVGSAWAAGVQGPGDMLVKLGGACDILLASQGARPDPRVFLDYHPVQGLFMPNGCMACSGSLLNWFAAQFGAAADDRPGTTRHQKLDHWAAQVPAGSDGVRALPYFLGEKTPIHDPLARGTFTGLGLHHGPGHLWRALLEGIAFGIRHHVEVFDEIGMPATRVLTSDGGSASTVWLQVIADVLDRPVQPLSGHPGSCLGAAWMAALGTGLSHDAQGAQAFVSMAPPVLPQAANRTVYDTAYREYRALYDALKPLFHTMGGAS
jgi:xylulokinase